MRVLAVITSLGMGGAQRHLARTSPALKSYGIEVVVCALDASGPFLTELRHSGIVVHGTRVQINPGHRSPKVAIEVGKAILDVRDLARLGRFDAVHSYLFAADVVATIGARLAGCPRIIVSRRNMHAERHRQTGTEHLLELGSNLLAHELVANSVAVLRDAEKHEAILPRRRGVIYNGVPVDEYLLAKPGQKGPLRLVCVGRLFDVKGQVYAIEAVQSLRDAGHNVVLTLVGDGPNRASLQILADRVGGINFVGEQNDPRPHLAAADIYVAPSVSEGFSNSIIEAMASGLPVVATDVGGNAEAIPHDGGILVRATDSAALASAIWRLGSNPEALASIGLVNRRRAESLFSLSATVDSLAHWYVGSAALAPLAS